MKIALIGFGGVGQGFVEILHTRRDHLRKTYGFEPQIVAVATNSRGALVQPGGLNLARLHEIGGGSLDDYPDEPGLVRGWNAFKIAERSNADVLVEVAFSNLETGLPAIDHTRLALENGKHVVLANKGPVALAYTDLHALAAEHNRELRFEATVMAGTPSLHLALDDLRGATITAARGILNGTTNYILTQMEAGMSYADALAEAQAKGYAEADPTADVAGWDAAGKVLILSAVLFGRQLRFDEMQVEGISHLTADDIAAAKAASERWKLIAQTTPDGGSVQPVRLPLTDPLAGVAGSTNALTLQTDLLGAVTLIGPGAGRLETGFAVLSDVLAIERDYKG